MTYFLLTGECPQGLNREKIRYYIIQYIPYVLLNGILFRKDFYGVLLRSIEVDQVDRVLYEFHEGSSGGHFSPRDATLKIMKGG